MSKIDYTEHKCDICGDGFRVEVGKKTNQSLKVVDMPVKSYDCEGRNYSKSMHPVDMCDKCFEEYWTFVQSKYDISSTVSGLDVKVKGEN